MAEENKAVAAPAVDPKTAAVTAAVARGVTVQGQPLEITKTVADPAAGTPAADGKPQRPANVPEKFWNAETGVVNTDALLKSYTELEGKQSKAPAATLTSEAAADPAAAAVADPAAAVAKTGVSTDDLTKAANEYATGGKLSDATVKALEAKGMSREVAEHVMEGFKAQGEAVVAAAFKETEGEENYKAMIAWAKTSLNQASLADFDQRVVNPKTSKLAVQGLYAMYAKANGHDGKIVAPAGGVPGVDTFKSKAEMVAAVSDKRYSKDTAYRAEVRAKLARTTKAGVELK